MRGARETQFTPDCTVVGETSREMLPGLSMKHVRLGCSQRVRGLGERDVEQPDLIAADPRVDAAGDNAFS